MIDFIKWIHLLSIMGLFGTTVWAFIHSLVIFRAGPQQGQATGHASAPFINALPFLCYLMLAALISGTLLIYPKHYTLHTPWISAAYLLLGVFGLGLWAVQRSKLRLKFIAPLVYSLLIAILIIIIHDAVTKKTFIFS